MKPKVEFVFPIEVSVTLLFPVDVEGILASNCRLSFESDDRYTFVTSPVSSKILVDQPSGLDTKNSTTSGSSPILLTVKGSSTLSPGLSTRLKADEEDLRALSKTMSSRSVCPTLVNEMLMVYSSYFESESEK